MATTRSLFSGGSPATTNLYGAGFTEALAGRITQGTTAVPATRHEPLLWVEKISASTRDTIPSAWDQGAAYFSLEKRSGNAYGAAVTAYARYFGGSGDLIGVHTRARLSTDGGRAYAAWVYAINTATAPDAWHGAEYNGNNSGGDLGHGGQAQLLRLCMADSTADANRMSAAVVVGKTTTPGGHNGFWTGLRIQADAIVSTASSAWDANGEAIMIEGHTDVTKKYGGIRFGAGSFKYALRTDEGTFLDTTPIRLGASHKISFSTTNANLFIRSNSNKIEFGQTIDILNPEETTVAVRVNGTRVLGPRRTGWTTAPTGTATKTTYDTTTVTTAQLAERVKALIDDLIFHGVIGP
jgi:hypothetical protein